MQTGKEGVDCYQICFPRRDVFRAYSNTATKLQRVRGEENMFAASVKKKKKEELGAGFALLSRSWGGEVWLLTSIFAKSVRLRVGNKFPGGVGT